MKRLLLLFVLIHSVAGAVDKFFVYLPTWTYPTASARDLKFPAGITMYYIHFSSHVSTTSPYFSAVTDPVSSGSDSAQLDLHQTAFRDTVQNNGAKFLLSITAQDNNLGNIAGNATQRKAFVSSVCAYMRRKGYDGLDLDWEANLGASSVTAVIKEFRDTLNARQPTKNILVMATIPDLKQYSSWNFYNPDSMDYYLDAYFGMNYGYSITVYDESIAYLNHKNMFDCPYERPTAAPWNTGDGYIYGTFKHNGITKWYAQGADTTKYGIGLWSGGTPMLNSNSSSVPGSSLSYPTAGFYSYQTIVNSGQNNLDTVTDSRWGIVGGKYTSWIDSAGAYKRTLWAKDTMHTPVFMLYDFISGFLATGQRYGRQPHFDAMVNAINFTTSPATAPTVITDGATNITQTSMTLTGTTSANGASTTNRFRYGTNSASLSDSVLVAQNPITGDLINVTGAISGLSASTKYYFRNVGYNSAGTGVSALDSATTLSIPTSGTKGLLIR